MAGWEMSSADIQNWEEATAELGGRYRALQFPHIHDHILRRIEQRKADLRAHENATRKARDQRWSDRQLGNGPGLAFLLAEFEEEDAA